MTEGASAGRWGGRLTSRPLPDSDATIDALSPEARDELVTIWTARAASELRVATSFAVVADDLRVVRADEALVRLAERGVDDEHRHHRLCLLVASRLKGSDVAPPEPLEHAIPEHPGAPERLLPSLHVLGHCVMNETFASVFLEASLGAARGPVTQSAVRELLSDEIDHARIGWAYLAGASASVRRELQPWLLDVARANLRMWRETPRAYPTDPRVVEQGAPSAELVGEALRSGVADLVVPGLRHLGFDVAELCAWMSDGAPT